MIEEDIIMLDIEGILFALKNTTKMNGVVGKEKDLSTLRKYCKDIRILSFDVLFGELNKQNLLKTSINEMYGYASSICQEAKTDSPFLTERLVQSVKVMNALELED